MSWSHAPLHTPSSTGIFIATCGTYLKRPLYHRPADLDLFQSQLFAVAKEHQFLLHAWCLLRNHYHLIIDAGKETLEAFFRHLHSIAAVSAAFPLTGLTIAAVARLRGCADAACEGRRGTA